MAGFYYYGHLLGADNPATVDILIEDSATITLGDAVDINTNGGCQPADAGDKVYGIVVGLVGKDGTPLSTVPTGDYDGTYSGHAGIVGSETYVAAADNLATEKIKAKVIADPFALFMNDAAGDMTYADDYQFFDLTDEDQIADQDGHATAGAFQLVKRDPDDDGDDSKGLFRIAEWQGYPFAQQ